MQRSVVLLLAFASAPVHAEELAFERRRTIEELEALARWCTHNKLFAARNECFEAILDFEPGHVTARKWLRYKKQKDGTWKRNARYTPPRNLNADAEIELRERRAQLAVRMFNELARVLGPEAKDVPRPTRRAAWRLILAIDAEHARAHSELEHTQFDGHWVLAETVRSIRRREQIIAMARQALQRAPAAAQRRVSAAEMKLGVTWSGAVQAGRWRVVSATPQAETRRLARRAAACDLFFASLFDVHPAAFDGRVLHVVPTRAQFNRIIAAHPALDKGGRRLAEQSECYWIGKTYQAVLGTENESMRAEWSARLPIVMLLFRHYRIGADRGWIWEGLGLHLGYRMCGQHRTWWVQRTRYAEKTDRSERVLWKQIMAPDAQWLEIARELAAANRGPGLRFLVTKGTNQMDGADLVWSYAFATYLLEGFPTRVPKLLARIGSGTASADAISKEIGFELPELEQRLVRWLSEQREK